LLYFGGESKVRCARVRKGKSQGVMNINGGGMDVLRMSGGAT